MPVQPGVGEPATGVSGPQLADAVHLLLQEVSPQEVAALGPTWAGPKGRRSGASVTSWRRRWCSGCYLLVLGRLLRGLGEGAPPGFASSGDAGSPRASAQPARKRPTPLEPPPAGEMEARREVGAGGPRLHVDQAVDEATGWGGGNNSDQPGSVWLVGSKGLSSQNGVGFSGRHRVAEKMVLELVTGQEVAGGGEWWEAG